MSHPLRHSFIVFPLIHQHKVDKDLGQEKRRHLRNASLPRFLDVLDTCEGYDVCYTIALDEECKPSQCLNLDLCGDLFSGVTYPGEFGEGCEDSKTVKYVVKDVTPPQIGCGNYCDEVVLNYCDFVEGSFFPAGLTVTDNCDLDGIATVDPVPLDPANLCEEKTYDVTYEAEDNCGNKASDLDVVFHVEPPTIVYTGPESAIANCEDSTYPRISLTEEICGVENRAFAVDASPGNPQACGTETVRYTFKDACDEERNIDVDVIVTDRVSPVFQCPASGNFCSEPPKELTATDCQWPSARTYDPVYSGAIPSVCTGGTFARTWTSDPDGCGNSPAMCTQTVTIPAQGPSIPTLSANPTTCNALPSVCVNVPVCGAAGETSTRTQCTNRSGGGFTFGSPSGVVNPCGQSLLTVPVTYVDSATGCTSASSSPGVSYTSSCCCSSTSTAYVQYRSSNTNPVILDHCFTQPPISANGGNWGWYFGDYPAGTSQTWTDLIIGAGRGGCDTSKGYTAGTANVSYNSSTKKLTVTLTAATNVFFTKTQIWFGTTPLPVKSATEYFTAPGQYNYKNEALNYATTFTAEISSFSTIVDKYYFAIHVETVQRTGCSGV